MNSSMILTVNRALRITSVSGVASESIGRSLASLVHWSDRARVQAVARNAFASRRLACVAEVSLWIGDRLRLGTLRLAPIHRRRECSGLLVSASLSRRRERARPHSECGEPLDRLINLLSQLDESMLDAICDRVESCVDASVRARALLRLS
ncbi:MAG: hypothetical protein HRF50_08435 [Phycisphaerae bacterium]|jgi:hypothetical protein